MTGSQQTHVGFVPPSLERPRLRFMTCGSVDDGKSTLIGRLLLESGALYEDHLEEARRAGGSAELDLSFLVDGLKAEREQGITIDVAYRYFATGRRSFLIADAPGHEQYTRNQAAAASQTDLAIVLVSAPDGVQPQTRRHMAIASMFGVSDVIIAINKMDRTDWSEERFSVLERELTEIAGRLNLNVVATLPLSAREGGNVVTRSEHTPWYQGPTLLELLETHQPRVPIGTTAIIPVAHTGRFENGGRVSFGSLSRGVLNVGSKVYTDGGQEATIRRLWNAGVPAKEAAQGDAVALELTPEIDLGRGSVLAAAAQDVSLARQLQIRFVWLADTPLLTHRGYMMEIGSASTTVRFGVLEGRMDFETVTLTPVEGALVNNDVAVARLQLLRPVCVLPFSESRDLGSFILIDPMTRKTVAAGIVLGVDRRASDTPWQTTAITPALRAQALGQKATVIWLTGLSGAGKSTISDLLDRRLLILGRHSALLDGDNLRQGLNVDLGFSDADRSENVRRVGEVAGLMADAGLIAIVSLISPFQEDRERAREAVGAERFIEVFVDAPLEVCRDRDPKGMYARAASGSIKNFTGVGAAYEPPPSPDIHLRTDQISPSEAVEQIILFLEARGLLGLDLAQKGLNPEDN